MNIKVGVKGRYRLYTKKGGEVTKDTDWFDNLITNTGLDNIGSADNFPGFCSVGSSSATPQFTDTQLGSRIATVGASGASDGRYSSFRVDSINRYAVFTWVYTFTAGTATGNIAEVGVGPLNNGLNITSRARVLDSGGIPTTITVLADEDLVVVWELFVKQSIVDYSNSLTARNATTRASRVDATSGAGAWNAIGIFIGFTRCVARAFTGAISTITGEPSGVIGSQVTGTVSPYVSGNYYRDGVLTWGTSAANGAAIKSIQWNMGPTAWQTEFDPVIPAKNNQQTLRITVRVSWVRDNGPA